MAFSLMLSILLDSREQKAPFDSTAIWHAVSRTVPMVVDRRSTRPAARVVVFVDWPVAAPQPLPSPQGHRRKADGAPRLIAADAALILIERWRTELNVLRRRSPTSDAGKTLADCVDELCAAITAGHDVTVQLTVSEAHGVSHIPVSTLRWLCNHRPEVIGARKREGIWYIDRTTFERYLADPTEHAAPPRAASPAVRIRSDKIIPLSREARADTSVDAR